MELSDKNSDFSFPDSLLIWFWYNGKWQIFSLSEIQQICEAFFAGKKKVVFEDKIVFVSSNLVFFKEDLNKGFPIIKKFYGKPFEFQPNSFEMEIEPFEFERSLKDFYYPSLFGLLRVAELLEVPLNLSLEGMFSKKRIFKKIDFLLYKEIFQDFQIEDSVLYQEYLCFLEDVKENNEHELNIMDPKMEIKSLIEIYKQNPLIFRKNIDEDLKTFLNPYYWILNKIVKESIDNEMIENKVFVGAQLSESQLAQFKYIFDSNDSKLQNLSLIFASKSRFIAEMLGNTIIEINFTQGCYNGILLDEDEVLIPSGNTLEITEIEILPDKTNIKLKTLPNKIMNKIQIEEQIQIEEPQYSIANQRVKKEIKEMSHFVCHQLDDTHIKFVIRGVENYEHGSFQIDFQFPPEYPYKAPLVKFDTKILHPNIDPKTGQISLNLLKEKWSPAMTCENLLLEIQNLLRFPNFDEIFENFSEQDSLNCRVAFCRDAKNMVEKYADKRKEIENLEKEEFYGEDAIKELIKRGQLANLEEN